MKRHPGFSRMQRVPYLQAVGHYHYAIQNCTSQSDELMTAGMCLSSMKFICYQNHIMLKTNPLGSELYIMFNIYATKPGLFGQ